MAKLDSEIGYIDGQISHLTAQVTTVCMCVGACVGVCGKGGGKDTREE